MYLDPDIEYQSAERAVRLCESAKRVSGSLLDALDVFKNRSLVNIITMELLAFLCFKDSLNIESLTKFVSVMSDKTWKETSADLIPFFKNRVDLFTRSGDVIDDLSRIMADHLVKSSNISFSTKSARSTLGSIMIYIGNLQAYFVGAPKVKIVPFTYFKTVVQASLQAEIG